MYTHTHIHTYTNPKSQPPLLLPVASYVRWLQRAESSVEWSRFMGSSTLEEAYKLAKVRVWGVWSTFVRGVRGTVVVICMQWQQGGEEKRMRVLIFL